MRLHIFGASGSGVTTLGETLSAKLDIPYIDSDQYFWLDADPPFTKRRDANERNTSIISELHKHSSWILGGSVIHWSEKLFPEFDLLIFLWIPPETRLSRLRQREFDRYGNIIFTDPERRRQFEKFMTWAADYDHDTGIANRTLAAHRKWMANINSPLLKLETEMTTQQRIRQVLDTLSYLGFPIT